MSQKSDTTSVHSAQRPKIMLILPALLLLLFAGVGTYLAFRGQAATPTPTFKLFAPAWRGLGGDANLANLKNFTQIFGRGRTVAPTGTFTSTTKFYQYTLGPYVVIRYVNCELIPPTQPYLVAHPGSCGKASPTLTSGMARGIESNKVVWTNDFGNNNFLLVPDDSQTISYVRNDAAKLPAMFDGLFSDSMGFAPLTGTGYLNELPRKPGTIRQYTPEEWIPAQIKMLRAKKSGLPEGKTLIINGLANGKVYFSGAANASPRAFVTVDEVSGVMAERIFREPSKGADAWRSPEEWKMDVDMIADVQAKGKLGYWWTKCWAVDNNTCKTLPNANEVITQWRRYSVASFLLGAGSNSYYNYDTDKTDDSPANYLGSGKTEANAAEWFAGDYTKAQNVGVATSAYVNNGGVYKRTFSNGIVLVNPDSVSKTINLGAARYSDFNGATLTGDYSVPARTGNVLVSTNVGGGGDTTPPTVNRTAPAARATISGTLTVKGTAGDNVGVTKVELLVDNAVKGADTTSGDGISISINSSSLANGPHTLALKAWDAAGNTTKTAAITITVSNTTPPPNPTITGFSANPNPVTSGNRAWLTWSTTNTTSCSINPDGVRNTTSFSWQTPILSTIGSKTYTLDCINSAGTHVTKGLSLSVTVAKTPPSKPLLTASPTTIRPGQSTRLNWSSTGATSCTLQPGSITSSGSVGSYVATPASTTDYTVTCKNAAGSTASDAVKVTVSKEVTPPAAPVIVSFVANPAAIEREQHSELSWSTSNVKTGGCRLAPSPLSSTDGSGTWVTPSLNASTSYTLTCVNSAGVSTSKSVNVTVAGAPAPEPPPPVDPDTGDESADQPYFEEGGETIDNGAIDEELTGLAVLDPTNITDKAKIKNIDHVEYYLGEKLLSSDDAAPFAFDTTQLKNGTYTITERTYFKDGSTSEVVRTVVINNKTAATATKSGANISWLWWGGGIVAFVMLAFILFLLWRRRRASNDDVSPYVVFDDDVNSSYLPPEPSNDQVATTDTIRYAPEQPLPPNASQAPEPYKPSTTYAELRSNQTEDIHGDQAVNPAGTIEQPSAGGQLPSEDRGSTVISNTPYDYSPNYTAPTPVAAQPLPSNLPTLPPADDNQSNDGDIADKISDIEQGVLNISHDPRRKK